MPLCIVALKIQLSLTGPTSERTPRCWWSCHPSLPPSLPPCLLPAISLSSGWTLTQARRYGRSEEYSDSRREFIFLEVGESADSFCCIMTCWITVLGIQWMYGQKNAHVLTPIFGDHFRRGEGEGAASWDLLTSQWFNYSHHHRGRASSYRLGIIFLAD